MGSIVDGPLSIVVGCLPGEVLHTEVGTITMALVMSCDPVGVKNIHSICRLHRLYEKQTCMAYTDNAPVDQDACMTPAFAGRR